ncbi:MAG: tripartite tricarboxylate transporter substrate binding protein [Alphaproteobacteria bacterium]|nr:tripartite tricarboxylate transporter substrate binding protein [Alphaproteobacteria bacterium]
MARSLLLVALCVALLALSPKPGMAETYPAHPVTLVVPFPPGGPTDVLGRLVGERMARSLGQSVVIDNASGAGGTVGTAKVARAAADGYTLCVGQLNSHVFGPAVYSIPYDVLGDFEPVGLISISTLMLVARADIPVKDMAGLVDWLKAHREPATFATVGVGSPAHIWTVEFTNRTGVPLQLIPYRGGAPAIQDILAGRIDLSSLEGASLMPHVRAGKMKPLGVLSAGRWKAAPDVPTFAEQGYAGFEMPFWTGLFVRKGTPPAAVARLNAALVESLADATVARRIDELGQDIPPLEQQTPQALGARHRADIDKWWPLIKAANIKAE